MPQPFLDALLYLFPVVPSPPPNIYEVIGLVTSAGQEFLLDFNERFIMKGRGPGMSLASEFVFFHL